MEGSGGEGKGGEECMERGGEGKGYNVNEFYVIFSGENFYILLID